ncbi:TIGR02302 family protein [Rhodovulum sulfidophilum]|uniref:TIGR02302 family protein n=1 Tax=Rhodovulum sulfidophilum TaxID=35806 RepID=A0ABS1RQ31_RHOSU|nr:TIGR02302 family protein [Rhodovulum sulfidophilum]MBL3607627.1 TIGR02302 family protein [Rhodovulum sulfidophilum]
MTDSTPRPDDTLAELRWPLRLTWAGLLAERLSRAFWPLASLVLLVAAALAFGAHDLLSPAAAFAIGGALLAALLGTLVYGLRSFRRPGRAEALDRLDRSLPGRPIAALSDSQAIGAGDPASEAVWRAHVTRMAARARAARAVAPDLRLSSRDPYGLRHVALIAFTVALIFGSFLRVASVADLGKGGPALGSGPSWEGWIEPPAYTAKPAIYLNDISDTRLAVPQGSRVTLRLYGAVGALDVTETVSGREPGAEGAAAASAGTDAMARSFEVVRDGRVEIDGSGGRSWQIVLSPDIRPEVRLTGEIDVTADGEMRQPFSASDDYGVTAGEATITLDLAAVERRYGLAAEPDPRAPLVLDLPMPISGDRRQFTETLVENLSQHPWAGLPVQLELAVEDALGQRGVSAPAGMVLPGRRFFDPLARAVVEQRQALLWARSNAREVAQILRAISYRPDEIFRNESAYLQLRVAIRRLERAAPGLTAESQAELAGALWDIAVLIEDGDLSDAAERLRRAQERLSEAMRNGASDAEIAQLMDELREATRDYMRQLAEQQKDEDRQQAQNGEMQELTGDQLQQMLDRLQQLMEEGRMAEAQQLLQMLQQMMENMQVTQGPGGDSPGQQAMEGLAETLRDQQGLSDDAFRDLQEQFNPGQQGQGEGREGEGERDRADPGQGGEGGQQSLAERQEALRRELERQQQTLPGLGASPESEGTREALDRAGRAMDEAERSLRDNDLAGALDDQARAMEALREGMRNLGEALAQNRQQRGEDGQGRGRADAGGERRDPLGRAPGSTGQVGTEDSMLQGEDVYRRARDLLDEIRRRSGEQNRPDLELDYLRRLLERF